jgi:histidine triad (HIT) family protein
MSDCLFCKIVNGTIPAAKLFEDQNIVAFADINPQSPTHVLVIPKKHIASLNAAGPEDTLLLGQLLEFAAKTASQSGLNKGYRLAINTGEYGGQTVDHLHIHVLGGRQMHWPPG